MPGIDRQPYPFINSETTIVDDYGNDAEVTMFNQLKVAESYRLSGGVFNGSVVDTNFFTSVDANGGSCSVANSELTCATTTTSGSSTFLYANSLSRYVGANMNYYRSVLRLGDTGATNNIRRWGCTDTQPTTNGCYFQLSGTTFSLVTMKAGVATVVNSGVFNGNGSLTNQSFTIDTNYHTYEIYITHRRIMFVIDDSPVHTVVSVVSSLMGTWHLKPFIQNSNTGVGTAVNAYTSVMTINRYGTPVSQSKSFFQQGTTAGVLLKTGPGAVHSLNISGISNNAVVTIYDGLSTSGIIKYTTGTMSNQTIPLNVPLDGDGGVNFDTGLFMAITGANCNCLIKYE